MRRDNGDGDIPQEHRIESGPEIPERDRFILLLPGLRVGVFVVLVFDVQGRFAVRVGGEPGIVDGVIVSKTEDVV